MIENKEDWHDGFADGFDEGYLTALNIVKIVVKRTIDCSDLENPNDPCVKLGLNIINELRRNV